jgi:hypothetical protein
MPHFEVLKTHSKSLTAHSKSKMPRSVSRMPHFEVLKRHSESPLRRSESLKNPSWQRKFFLYPEIDGTNFVPKFHS